MTVLVDSDILIEVMRGQNRIITTQWDRAVDSDIDRETGQLAGDLMREFAASHNVEIADALIAAGAMIHEAALWTKNRKHYPAKGLRFFTPSVG